MITYIYIYISEEIRTRSEIRHGKLTGFVLEMEEMRTASDIQEIGGRFEFGRFDRKPLENQSFLSRKKPFENHPLLVPTVLSVAFLLTQISRHRTTHPSLDPTSHKVVPLGL